MLNACFPVFVYVSHGLGIVPTLFVTCCNTSWSVASVRVIRVSTVNQETCTSNVHKLITMCYAHVLYQSQICLRCIMFPVVCAGPEQCLLVKTEQKRAQNLRQTHSQGVWWPLYLDLNGCCSQRGIFNIPHLVWSQDKNRFGSQQAGNMGKVDHVECTGCSSSTLLPYITPCCSHC